MPGPFHRVESPTQTSAVAAEQVLNGEIWGRTPRGGMVPTVQAYTLGLPNGRRGVEFVTLVDPHLNGSPLEVRWYLGRTNGVQRRERDGEEFAAIAADVENHQPALRAQP